MLGLRGCWSVSSSRLRLSSSRASSRRRTRRQRARLQASLIHRLRQKLRPAHLSLSPPPLRRSVRTLSSAQVMGSSCSMTTTATTSRPSLSFGVTGRSFRHTSTAMASNGGERTARSTGCPPSPSLSRSTLMTLRSSVCASATATRRERTSLRRVAAGGHHSGPARVASRSGGREGSHIPAPGPRQSCQVMPSSASGRVLSRAWCRVAAAMLVVPARRRAPIAALCIAAMTSGPVPVRIWERSSS